MSYKHNDLMAMREQYWQDQSAHVLTEKAALQQLLSTLEVMPQPSLEDAKYVLLCSECHSYIHLHNEKEKSMWENTFSDIVDKNGGKCFTDKEKK